jgi:hypothetical protein
MVAMFTKPKKGLGCVGARRLKQWLLLLLATPCEAHCEAQAAAAGVLLIRVLAFLYGSVRPSS